MAESRRVLAAFGVGIAAFGAAALGSACGGSTFASRSAAAPVAPVAPAPSVSSVPIPPNAVLQAKVRESVARTIAMHSARASISVTLTGLGDAAVSTGAFDIAGTGLVDLRTGNADLALSVPRFDRVSGGGAVEQRIVSGVVYAKLPVAVLRQAGLPATVHWLRLDPRAIGTGGPADLSQAQADPARALGLLAAASAAVRADGSESVRGVPCTQYSGSIDVSAARRATNLPAAVRTELTELGSVAGAHRVELDAWLDSAGRTRRVVVSMPLTGLSTQAGDAAVGPDAMIRVQADFYGFGGPVAVAVPPQNQVRPYNTLRLDAVAG